MNKTSKNFRVYEYLSLKYGIHCISSRISRLIQMSFHKHKHCIPSGSSDYLYSNHHNKQYILTNIRNL